MRASVSSRLILPTTIAVASIGFAHTQRPENQIYVVSEDASGVSPWPHNQEQAGSYYKRCTSDCRAQYNECVEEQEEAERERAKKLDFRRMDQAIAWLREHKTEVALGTLIVVGGVTFVLMTGGSGALILAPLAL